MKKSFLFLLFNLSILFFASAQNETSTENFIAYKFPQQVDSLLVLTMDSFNQEFVQNAYIVIDLGQSYFIISKREKFDSIISPHYIVNDKKKYYDCITSLHLSRNLKLDTSLGGTLAKNTNCYFVSLSRKYKIPIIFSEDEILRRNQYKQYELTLFEDSGFHLLYIYLMGDEIISNYRDWSVFDVLNRKKHIFTTSPLK
ncbi:MAG: hypothetical protein WCP69_01005 [Bacteroidota bacterium]